MIQNKPKTVKDAVILVLSKEWPLTARKLYNTVKNRYGMSVTYQAVHKVLKQVLEEGVIERDGNNYSINPLWIKKNKEFFEELGLVRDGSKKLAMEDVLSRDLTEIKLDNLFEFYAFALNFLEKVAETSKGGVCCKELYHMYWALAGSKKEQEQFRNILKQYKMHFLCRGNTFADKMLAKFYEGFGAKVKIGANCAKNCDVIAVGDYTVQVFFDKNLKKELDKLYESANESSSADMSKLYKQIFDKKVRISVVIKKDPELTKEIIENVVSQFDKKGPSTESFVFNTVSEVDAFLVDLGLKTIPKNKKSIICLEWDHFWTPLFLDKDVYKKMKSFAVNTVLYTITSANTAIDRWCYEFWKKLNVKAKIGVGNRDSCVVLDDSIIRIFYPKDILDEMDKIFSSAKDINDIDTDKLFHRLFEKKTEIPVTITNNPALAKQIRERIMGYFKK